MTLPTLAFLFLTCGLFFLTYWDWKFQLLPTIPMYVMLFIGLLCNTQLWFCDWQSSLLGIAAGYLSLWAVAKSYYLLTGKIGMGNGDFILLAMLGAWVGWQFLPLIILIASTLGSSVGLSLILFKQQSRDTKIAFGPYLAIAGWLVLFINFKPLLRV